jgi:hypothetical protein
MVDTGMLGDLVGSASACAVAAMRAISASRTACRIGCVVLPSNVMPLMIVLMMIRGWWGLHFQPRTARSQRNRGKVTSC